MAALDNPFYFSLAEEDRVETAALLGPRSSSRKPQLLFGPKHESVKYYNLKQQQQQTNHQHHQQQQHEEEDEHEEDCSASSRRRRQNPLLAPHRTSVLAGHRINQQGGKKKLGVVWWSNSGMPSGGGAETMWDIAIYRSANSQAAALWANYLTSCFQQISSEEKRTPFKLNCVNVEDLVSDEGVDGQSEKDKEGGGGGCWNSPGAAYSSRLQIVVICPKLVEALGVNTGNTQPLLAALWHPATVLAMLLGVQPHTLHNHPLAGLFRFEQWRKLTVKDQDPTFVGDLMGVSMDILSRSWQLEQAIHQMNIDNNKAHFSIVPKKIKVGQNKLIVLLTIPLSSSDKINIYVDKQGQQVEVTNIKRRNPYTLQFSMPVSCMQTSTLVSVNVERNGRSVGTRVVKCESRLRELDQILRAVDNPIQFMAQAVGLSVAEKDELDNFLVGAFQRNMPPDFNLLASNLTPAINSRRNGDEYPTLLHFCARYGLEKLCWELIECPGGEHASQLPNASHQTPADIAQAAGHHNLANALKGYMQMSELTSMYHYIKGISEKPQVVGEMMEDCNYLLPRPLSEAYSVPPAARPVTLAVLPRAGAGANTNNNPGGFYLSPRPPPPLTPTSPTSPDFIAPNYLHMHSPASDQSNSRLDIDFCQGKYQNVESQSVHSDQYSLANSNHQEEDEERQGHVEDEVGGTFHQLQEAGNGVCHQAQHNSRGEQLTKNKQPPPTVRSPTGSTTSGKTSPQDELVEIINDFKNNVFTISEVEKLVEAWRNRNDVQQSFREKQEQLNQMRQEYDRIQQAMKDQMKSATPLEKIKKFFSRKSKSVDSSTTVNKGRTGDGGVCQRPVSSLSLHSSCSSSSSGRMSTASGTSLGDSGTHSDHDDKKSEDFIFPEKLPSVKEKEFCTRRISRIGGEELRRGTMMPPATTLVMIHAPPPPRPPISTPPSSPSHLQREDDPATAMIRHELDKHDEPPPMTPDHNTSQQPDYVNTTPLTAH